MSYILKEILKNGDLNLEDCTDEIWKLDIEINEDGTGIVKGNKKELGPHPDDDQLLDLQYEYLEDGTLILKNQTIRYWYKIKDCKLASDFRLWCQQHDCVIFYLDNKDQDVYFGAPYNYEFYFDVDLNKQCKEVKPKDIYDLFVLFLFVDWLNATTMENGLRCNQ